MVAKTNYAGTLSNVFSIGKGGPTIRQGSSVPTSGLGADGDIYLRYGTPGTYLKMGGTWQLLTPNALPSTGGTITGSLTINGAFSHNGLSPTAGTGIDQISTWTLPITISTAWQDTTINATDLDTGTYVVQVLVNDLAVNGGQTNEYYSGVMSWYSDDTDEITSTEITLHHAGVKNADNAIFLRVQRTLTANIDDMKLQIAGTYNDTGPTSVTFKFRRLI